MADKSSRIRTFLSNTTPNLFAGAIGSIIAFAATELASHFGVTFFSNSAWQAILAMSAFLLFLPVPILGHAMSKFATSLTNRIWFIAAKGDRITIIVAGLEFDDDGRLGRRVELALNDQLNGELKGRVEIIRVDDILSIGNQGKLAERLTVAEQRGAVLLARSNADLLVWGSVLVEQEVIELRFLARNPNDVFDTPRSYLLDQTLRLPDTFQDDCNLALLSIVISLASPIDEVGGRDIQDLIRPAVARLKNAIDTSYKDFVSDTHIMLSFAYAIACFRLGEITNDQEQLKQSENALRFVLAKWPRDRSPDAWASMQNYFGGVLVLLNEHENHPGYLSEAASAFRSAIEATSCVENIRNWAGYSTNLGTCLAISGSQSLDTALKEEAISTFSDVLNKITKLDAPIHWAGAQYGLGGVLFDSASSVYDLDQARKAVEIFRDAHSTLIAQDCPVFLARIYKRLGVALSWLGMLKKDIAMIAESNEQFEAALKVYPRKRFPNRWANTQLLIGINYGELARNGKCPTRNAKRGIKAIRGAISVFNEGYPTSQLWNAYARISSVQCILAMAKKSPRYAKKGVAELRAALIRCDRTRFPHETGTLYISLGFALTSLAKLTSGDHYQRDAQDAFNMGIEFVKIAQRDSHALFAAELGLRELEDVGLH